MTVAYILTLSCPDQPGIVTRVTGKLYSYHGNIVEAAQFEDVETGRFFMRVVFTLRESTLIDGVIDAFGPFGRQFAMEWAIRRHGQRR